MCYPAVQLESAGLTLEAALHMSATILPETRVSKMLVVAKLNTFSRATCTEQRMQVITKCAYSRIPKRVILKKKKKQSSTLKMSKEHCVRMVLKVEDRPSSTRLSR